MCALDSLSRSRDPGWCVPLDLKEAFLRCLIACEEESFSSMIESLWGMEVFARDVEVCKEGGFHPGLMACKGGCFSLIVEGL